ncbi:MAG: MBL fold metallo-hydrolase [Thermoguttaceae bacterium]|nr:MBL fold metallo-hydrolase [Thermoguttaceae bacterium]
MKLDIVTICCDFFETNCYLLHAEGRDDCVVIDSGSSAAILTALRERGWTPSAILITHGHLDHICGLPELHQAFPEAVIGIGVNDAAALNDSHKNLSALLGFPTTVPAADQTFADNESVTFAGIPFTVREIPGHTPGHVVYAIPTTQPQEIFVGDVIFQGSIGRTDFPGGSHSQLVTGIREKLYTQPDATRLHPGHGGATSVGDEKKYNAFV